MSLGIAFKGSEGMVLAADSRVTLTRVVRQNQNTQVLQTSTFDNATKLFNVRGYKHIGIVTYGLGALGGNVPRTPHSLVPEFEAELAEKEKTNLTVFEFATEFGDFFVRQWKALMTGIQHTEPLVFLIGGHNVNEPYGRIYQIKIPAEPTPTELYEKSFGIAWGGQTDLVNRLLNGMDKNVLELSKKHFNLDDPGTIAFMEYLRPSLALPIPYQFLPLQDCVNLSIFLIKMTIQMQSWIVGTRGVGGAIDVAIIDRINGFRHIQKKIIVGEDNALYFNNEEASNE